MPEIRPLRAWRYNQSLTATIDDLTSPLFDVVSEKQRKALYQNPYNSIHLSVPQGPEAATAKQPPFSTSGNHWALLCKTGCPRSMCIINTLRSTDLQKNSAAKDLSATSVCIIGKMM
jgi:hypothetical protein